MGRAHEVRAASMAKTAAAKSKLNNKWSRIIYMAAKSGLPDPDLNQNLKKEIEKAKKEQVTADVIKRAIEKAKGANMESYSELLLEGFGPGNSNRTQTAVKIALQKCGGKIAGSGSVTYMFDHLSIFSIENINDEELLEVLLMADCEVNDIEVDENLVTVFAPNTEYSKIRTAIREAYPDIDFLEDSIAWVGKTEVELTEEKQIEQFKRLLDMLEEEDDVQEVFHNVVGLN